MTNALYVAWRSGDDLHGRWGPVGRLEHGPLGYRFFYTRGAQTLEGFRPFSGMGDLTQVYESDDLFPLFANRLLAPSRPEYEAFLKWGGFDPHHGVDPIAVLGVTGGTRATDSVEVFPCPAPDPDGCYITKFFLHGIRWMGLPARERTSQLKEGDHLGLMLDFMNSYDPYAVAVRTFESPGQVMLGYVPRYLARDMAVLALRCQPNLIRVTVVRVNADAPLQHRLLCQMSACWPEGFRPCSGEEFEPLVGEPPVPVGSGLNPQL